MSLLSIVTLAGFGILIAALAVYLLAAIALLARTSSNLKSVIANLAGLPPLVAPLDDTLLEINGRLKQLKDALD